MKVATFVCLAAIGSQIIVPKLASAQTSAIAIIEPKAWASCGGWLAQRAIAPHGAAAWWLLGYLDGAAEWGSAEDLLKTTDVDAVLYSLEKYCREHPRERALNAARALVRELRAAPKP